MKKRVLFLCTGNSCRSQMAEGILRQLYRDKGVAELALRQLIAKQVSLLHFFGGRYGILS